MVKLIKRLFCKHYYAVKRWHYTHGPCDNEPAIMEVEHVCIKCGKVRYTYPKRGSKEEKYLLDIQDSWIL